VDALKHTDILDNHTAVNAAAALTTTTQLDDGNDLAIDLNADPEEYDYAWGRILAEFGDYDCYNRDSGEAWQYVGTLEGKDGYSHEFRHRDLPATGERTYVAYPASEGFPRTARQIAERLALKEESYGTAIAAAIDGGVEAEVWLALTERLAFVNGALKTLSAVKSVLVRMEGALTC
jgi:hypothetical protein